ncbi:DegT/DnrJ/EryC1/StrS family aminotransferase [Cytophagaceae bacterium ABcell3]|nr:DegT/DnrJ/EryC1/StrS family aminotransferase [Cytophagaceae bacterium ABcell3]
MNKIQMVDLYGQYHKIKSEVDQAISNVIEKSAFINGFEVKNFEAQLAKYLGTNFCIGCASGTDALQIAYMALGLKPGDEIILPSFTYIATAEAAALLGLVPIFADSEPSTFNIDPKDIESKISAKTKAIVPVHLFGQCANMEEILNIARKHQLYVIEDTAQALGSSYTFSTGKEAQAGTMGDIGITSFFPSKNLGCFGDGGALFTKSGALAEKIRMIANHGQKQKYYHDIIGVNSRLDTLQAAILQVKLQKLDSYLEARRKAAAFYDQALGNIAEIEIPKRVSKHVFHQYTIKVEANKRDLLKEHLKAKEIPSMIYYPLPIHLQKAFTTKATKENSLPIAENLSKSVLSLPMHTELEEAQLEFITQTIKDYFN